jgi:hypothetical protein
MSQKLIDWSNTSTTNQPQDEPFFLLIPNGRHQSCQGIAGCVSADLLQVDNVELLSRGTPTLGTLHLTAHHLIFSSNVSEDEKPRELWICYPIIHTVERRQPLSLGVEGCALRFQCRDFMVFTLGFRNEAEGKDVFESVQKLTCVRRVLVG